MANQPRLTTPQNITLRLAHLNTIQNIIGRISGHSATVKNLTATLVLALLAIAYQQNIGIILHFSTLITIIMYILDSYYLGLERDYRNYYKKISSLPISLASDLTLDLPSGPIYLMKRTLRATHSFSMVSFYLLLVVAPLGLHIFNPPEDAKKTSESRPVVNQIYFRNVDENSVAPTYESSSGESIDYAPN